MRLTDEEKAALRSAIDQTAWNSIARAIKAGHGGQYPDDWWPVVLAPGGIADELKKRWAQPDAFDLKVI